MTSFVVWLTLLASSHAYSGLGEAGSLDSPDAPARATQLLLKLTPADSALVLVVEGMEPAFQAWPESSLRKRMISAGWNGRTLGGPGGLADAKIAELDRNLKAAVGLDLAGLNREVFGLSTVLAFKPGASESQDAGLMLVHARSAEILAKAVNGLFHSRQGKPERRRHEDIDYWLDTRPNGVVCLAVLGNVGVASQNEAALKEVITSHRRSTPGWGETKNAQAMRAATPPGLVHLYVLPRLLDHRLPPAKPKDVGEAAFIGMFLGAWQAVDWTSFSFAPEGDGRLDWQFALNPAKIPTPGSTAEKAAAGASTKSPVKPVRAQSNERPSAGPPTMRLPGALLAMTLSFNSHALAEWSKEWATRTDPQQAEKVGRFMGNLLMGLNPAGDVFTKFGPRICLAVAPGDRITPELLLAIEHSVDVASEAAPQKAGVQATKPAAKDAIEQALRFAMLITIFEAEEQQNQTWRLETQTIAGVRVHTARMPEDSSIARMGIEPSFVVHDKWVLFGSNRKVIEAALTGQAGPTRDEALRWDVKATAVFVSNHPTLRFLQDSVMMEAVNRVAETFPIARVRAKQEGDVHRLTFDLPLP